MIRPNYKDFRGSKFLISSGQCLSHSAKGSTWEEHKYIKRINGTYYYPDSYKGGRHLPDGEKGGGSDDSKDKLEDWEKTMYEDIDETLKRNPGLFDPKEIASDDFQDFKVTLSEFAGVDTDDLSEEEIERMRKKVKDHYSNEKAAGTSAEDDEESDEALSENDVENLAREVIRGNFGNGQQRKDLLGENYAQIQKRVNEILKGSGNKKVSKASKASVRKAEEAAKKVANFNVDAKKRVSYTMRF